MAETAPDATVNTLRELLTGHASYLGQLYASLGASDDVVPSKMQELHQALVLCIENQRKQAEEEIAAVHRELESLHGELKALAASLGCKLTPDQPDEALVTKLANRRGARADLQALRDERQAQVHGLVQELSGLLPVLEQPHPPLLSETSLTPARLTALQQLLEQTQSEVQRRSNQLSESLTEIEALHADMDLPLDDVFLSLCEPEIQPLAANLEKAARLQDKLEEERSRRETFIQETYEALFALWGSMGVDEAEADAFVDAHEGITQSSIDAYEQELERMKEWRRQNIGDWVRAEALEVKKLKVALFVLPESALESAEDEDEDSLLVEEGQEEAYLEELEAEKAQLHQDAESKSHLLHMLTRYFSILQEAKDLEASAHDPSRLTGKGARGDPGRLLREEKIRKRIAKEKPKLETDFLKLIPAWEAEHGPFLVHGERFLEELQEKLASKRTTTTRAGGPIRAQATGNRSVNSSSLSSGPIKRQQTGASHASSIVARPTSPHKRVRPNHTGTSSMPSVSSATSSHLPTPGSSGARRGAVPLPSTWGTQQPHQQPSHPSLRPPTAAKKAGRPSFKPRSSDLSSRAPSSLFSAGRTVSSTSSIGGAPVSGVYGDDAC